MPLPGGDADKLGNRYERWWTVSQLVSMLHGHAESIRIEDPGVIKAEFTMVRDGVRELHQAKRATNAGKWGIAALASEGISQAVFDQLVGNTSCFRFVSSCDAPELRELCRRARSAESEQEFTALFVSAKAWHAHFDRLKQAVGGGVEDGVAIDILKRVFVETISEQQLIEKVEWGLPALFFDKPLVISNALRAIAEDSIHKTLTRQLLIDGLAAQGYTLRHLARPEAVGPLVAEVTAGYINGARKKFISHSFIPRAASQTLVDGIKGAAVGSDFLLMGQAGGGKTACAVEVVEALRASGIPVLAFRLDRLEPVTTAVEIGRQLGLEESPALVVAAAATGGEAVLFVDQLDAVSTMSGKSGIFLDAVAELLAEARALRGQLKKIHVVVVCRAFDWDNDHRLRQMLTGQHAKVAVADFTTDEVKAVLTSADFSVALFQPNQLALLGLPQNLALFLEAGFDPRQAPAFNTAKELFDRYWDAKRQAVAERTGHQEDQWLGVIELLCTEMDKTQQLSVRKEKLDPFQPVYLAQMASEGVLIFDGRFYGFGHESFFDYCFARAFAAKDQPLTQFLLASEQHLFRRTQVRQLLAYLRDADRDRYCTELQQLLSAPGIRTHLKDLALALVASVPVVGDDEWCVLEPWLQSGLIATAQGEPNPDRLATLVWRHVFGAPSWFSAIDQRGLVAEWLAAENPKTVDMAVGYCRFHQRQAGDRIAELLEPYTDSGGEWSNRLRVVMEWADLHKSRRLFELFLRLLANGTLDAARGPIAVNSTFWSMLHGLAKARPEWIPEVIALWLRRRLVLIQQRKDANGNTPWRDLFTHDDFGQMHFQESATKGPAIFVEYVLPAVIEITDTVVMDSQDLPPKRGVVWSFLIKSEHESIDAACLSALVQALNLLAGDPGADLTSIIRELCRRDTYTANYLLLNLYLAGATRFADQAAILLCREPWRFLCGFADSSYWIATQLIAAVVPWCSSANRSRLEEAILGYRCAWEQSADGRKWNGHTTFTLLHAIPEEHRSRKAQMRFRQLERKYGKPSPAPRGVRVYSVGSPIAPQAADKMTDVHWLLAVAKYATADRGDRWEHPEKGGAWELAGMLQEHVRKQPERFARLCLQFPAGTNPAYSERTLEALKGADIATDLKLAVCRKAYDEFRQECGKAIADLLGSMDDVLPDDCIAMLHWLATEHPDPEQELWDETVTNGEPSYGGDIVNHGINTTRGRAAEAIRDLITKNAGSIPRFRPTIESLVEDHSLAVRACAASTLMPIAHEDTPFAIALFLKLAASDERLLQTHYVDRFIYYYGLGERFSVFRPFIEQMLRSPMPKVSEAGARLASLAVLSGQPAAKLVSEAMQGNAAQRQGIATVAASNTATAGYREWCEEHLLQLFNDTDTEVRRQAAACFRQIEKEPLEKYEELIAAFCDSAAYQTDSFPLLYILEESVYRLPGIICQVCEKFFMRYSDDAKDNSNHFAGDIHTVAKLIFRTYQQHQRDVWASRCLDLIDTMCLEGIQDVKLGLEDFER